MKRCIICGNVGKDDSTVCPVCGNPYLDLDESIGDEQFDIQNQQDDFLFESESNETDSGEKTDFVIEETAKEAEDIPSDATKAEELKNMEEEPDHTEESEEEEVTEAVREDSPEESRTETQEIPEGTQRKADPRQVTDAAARRRPARRTGGPQIYGGAAGAENASENQSGAFRRDIVNGRDRQGSAPAGPENRPRRPQGEVRRPAGQANPQNGRRQASGQGEVRRPAGKQPVRQNPSGPAGASAAAVYEASGSSMIRQRSRKLMHSPLFLLITLFQTVALAGSVAAIFMKQLNFSQIMRLITSIPLPSQITGYSDQLLKLMAKLDTDAVGINLALLIPDLLMCLGLWLMVFTSLTKKQKMSGAGFTFIKANVIITLIKNGAVMIAGLVISVALVVSAWVSGNQTMIAAAVITLVIMIIATMLVIMYSFSFIAMLSTFRSNAVYGENYGKASSYVAVVHILTALFSIIGLLSGIVNAEIAGIAEYAGKILWMLLFAVWIFVYRSRMSDDEDEE